MKKFTLFFLFFFFFFNIEGGAYSSEINLKCIYSKDKSKIASLKINFKTQEYQWQSNRLAPFHLENNILRGIIEYRKDVKRNTTLHTTMMINRNTGILMAKFYYLTDNEVKKFVEKAVDKILNNKEKLGKNANVLIETNVLYQNFTEAAYATFECKKSDTKF